jgi:hypothetical protein
LLPAAFELCYSFSAVSLLTVVLEGVERKRPKGYIANMNLKGVVKSKAGELMIKNSGFTFRWMVIYLKRLLVSLDVILSGAALAELESHCKMINGVNEEIWKQSLLYNSRELSPTSEEIKAGFDSKFGPFDSNTTASEDQFKLSIHQYLRSRINYSPVFLF